MAAAFSKCWENSSCPQEPPDCLVCHSCTSLSMLRCPNFLKSLLGEKWRQCCGLTPAGNEAPSSHRTGSWKENWMLSSSLHSNCCFLTSKYRCFSLFFPCGFPRPCISPLIQASIARGRLEGGPGDFKEHEGKIHAAQPWVFLLFQFHLR